MSFYALAALINFFTSLILGIFVLAKNKRDKINFAFSLFAFCVSFWSLAYYFWQIADNAQAALFWCRILMAGAIFIPPTYLHFVYAFTGLISKRKFFLLFSYLFFSIFLVLDATPWFVSRVEPLLDFKFWPLAGQAYSIFLILWFFYVVYSTYILYQKRRESQGILKVQLSYILAGMAIGFLGGSTNYFLWYKIPIPPLTNILVSFYVLAVAYAIVKHQLMNIKVIATEFFSIVLVLTTFFPIFETKSSFEFILRGLIFLFTLFFAILLVRSVHAEVNRREETEQLAKKLKKTSDELAKANEGLKQLDNAKSEFISIASHQLRTPLTAIKGFISMISDGDFGPISERIKTNLGKVYISNERLIRLVDDLLDISRIESGKQEFKFTKVHLEDLVKPIIEQLKMAAEIKKLKLIFHQPPKPTPLVNIDADKLHEVMMNFIDNSIKYTKKGKVEVFVTPEPKGLVTFCVKDTGMGIAPDVKPFLFQKFSRGEGSFLVHTEGLGLGLYVAKMMIDAHHGKIWADSEGADKGSSFCFSLPAGK